MCELLVNIETIENSVIDKHSTIGCWPEYLPGPGTDELLRLTDKMLPGFKALLAEEKIPENEAFIESLQCLYIPLCAWLVSQQNDRTIIVGINGSQGSGKSTLTKILSAILEQGFNKKIVSFSIDDLYKTHAQRLELAGDIHPLLETRGVPGTHDAELGISILNHFIQSDDSKIHIPVFDKSIDDRMPEMNWTQANGNCDIVIFEGWCVGSIAEDEHSLQPAMNELERVEDKDVIWRKYVNLQLDGVYAELFSLIDVLVMLKIPDFNKAYEWRQLQENKLKESIAESSDIKNKIMSDSEIERFIMHYERITRHTLDEMPERANIVLELDNDHHVKKVIAN